MFTSANKKWQQWLYVSISIVAIFAERCKRYCFDNKIVHQQIKKYPQLRILNKKKSGKYRSCLLIILSLNLEVRLWMSTYWTKLRSLLANDDVTAVRALPDHIALA